MVVSSFLLFQPGTHDDVPSWPQCRSSIPLVSISMVVEGNNNNKAPKNGKEPSLWLDPQFNTNVTNLIKGISLFYYWTISNSSCSLKYLINLFVLCPDIDLFFLSQTMDGWILIYSWLDEPTQVSSFILFFISFDFLSRLEWKKVEE